MLLNYSNKYINCAIFKSYGNRTELLSHSQDYFVIVPLMGTSILVDLLTTMGEHCSLCYANDMGRVRRELLHFFFLFPPLEFLLSALFHALVVDSNVIYRV